MAKTLKSQVRGETTPNITLSVVFGNPKRSCSGSGICQVIPTNLNDETQTDCQQVRVVLEWQEKQAMRWTIPANGICAKRLALWQQTGKLIISDDFHFPLWFTQKTGRAAVIPAGHYPISFADNGQLVIDLTYATSHHQRTSIIKNLVA